MSSPKLPKGWHDSPWTAFHEKGMREPENRPVKCDECEWEGFETDIEPLNYVADLNERLSPGSEVPVGECPACDDAGEECRSFVYYTDMIVAYRVKPNVLEQIVESTE